MLQYGDFVELVGDDNTPRWVVCSTNDVGGSALLVADGVQTRVPPDADEKGICVVLCRPIHDWPLLCLPSNPSPLELSTVDTIGRFGVIQSTRNLVDWVWGDPIRRTGPLYFNPALKLRHPDTVLLTYASGQKANVIVPTRFESVSQKIARVLSPESAPKGLWDRLMEDDSQDES